MSKRQARIFGNLELNVSSKRVKKDGRAYSGFAIIMMAVFRVSFGR